MSSYFGPSDIGITKNETDYLRPPRRFTSSQQIELNIIGMQLRLIVHANVQVLITWMSN